MTPFLRQVLEEWLAVHPGGPHLFCHAGEVGRSKKRSKTTGYKGDKTRARYGEGTAETRDGTGATRDFRPHPQ